MNLETKESVLLDDLNVFGGKGIIVKEHHPIDKSNKITFNFITIKTTVSDSSAIITSCSFDSKNEGASVQEYGPRELNFISIIQNQGNIKITNLPAKCEIIIYDGNKIIKKIDYKNSQPSGPDNWREPFGTYDWDMLTNNDNSPPHGIYVIYIDVPGVGVKVKIMR